MMMTLQSYVRRGKRSLRRWILDPRVHISLQLGGDFLMGFLLSAASLGNYAQPIAMGLVCGSTGWTAVLMALGSCLGYLFFWGSAGYQCILWTALALTAVLLLGNAAITERSPLLLPALAGLILSACGVVFQIWLQDTTPVPVYLVRVALGPACAWLFHKVLRGRDPLLDWLACGLSILALAQIAPFRYLGLGYLAAGAIGVAGTFPGAALAGLALDLAAITPVSMTAVLCGSYLVRFLPRYPRWVGAMAPGLVYILVLNLTGNIDILPLPGLLLGGILGTFLPSTARPAHRRGETGMAQVRLELASSVLAQTEQLLIEAPEVPVDEDALVVRAAERACNACPCRKSCKDIHRISQLTGVVLHKSLLSPEELPIVCRKSGRFLAELHRGQEQLRSIRADRERQREYRAAVVQQFRFLADFLQELSDNLVRRGAGGQINFQPMVRFYGNRPQQENGDRCMMFSGVRCKYYVLLCDGMGTGLGAVQEGKNAASLLRRLLTAGYPAEHALRSLNSLCALRDRAGAVTVDLVELELDTGRAVLYKWGAPPSYLVTQLGAEKLGITGPPPGLSVTDCRETTERFSLRRKELLVLVSDGISQDDALGCCQQMAGRAPGELALGILACSQRGGEDDATVAVIRLDSGGLGA